jgi:leucyl aminopeptidase (aminopeptidase T)
VRRFDRWLLTMPLPVQRVLIALPVAVLALVAAVVEGAKAAAATTVDMYALNERQLREDRASRLSSSEGERREQEGGA